MKPPRSAKARRRVIVTLEIETEDPFYTLRDALLWTLALNGDSLAFHGAKVLQASANVIKPDTLRARAKRGGRA